MSDLPTTPWERQHWVFCHLRSSSPEAIWRRPDSDRECLLCACCCRPLHSLATGISWPMRHCCCINEGPLIGNWANQRMVQPLQVSRTRNWQIWQVRVSQSGDLSPQWAADAGTGCTMTEGQGRDPAKPQIQKLKGQSQIWHTKSAHHDVLVIWPHYL